jgi:oligopeptide/dipeptide ABC transporter ATP-binding protein
VTLLETHDVGVSFLYRGTRVAPIKGVSFSVAAGESVGIVGESGSGKSTLALALLRLIPPARGLQVSGQIRFGGRDVLAMSAKELSEYRGAGVALIPQDPMTSLNPTLTIGRQIGEASALSGGGDVSVQVVEALRAVQMPEPEARIASYPHQLSGGMRQRAVGAVAIARAPKLLIADEPTTALDVTVQKKFLDMLVSLRRTRGMAMLLVSHDLGVVARVCERIIVMYAGQIVEDGPAQDILAQPRHWYTAALVASARSVAAGAKRLPVIPGAPPQLNARPPGCRFSPRCANAKPECAEPPALTVQPDGRRLRCHFPRGAA